VPDLSIVIVTFNAASCLEPCLQSIRATGGDLQLEVFVVDNASTDDTLVVAQQAKLKASIIRNERNKGFPEANNQAIAVAAGRYVMLLNPDTVLYPGALATLVGFMERHPECAICGPMLEDAAGTIAEDLRRPGFTLYLRYLVGMRRLLSSQLPPHRLEIVSGACLVFPRSLVARIGLLDPDLFWCEDVDYCVRAVDFGYRVMKVPEARVKHLVGVSPRSNVGLVLERQYTSKIKYLWKRASPLETRLVIGLFVIQAAARAAKWAALSAIRPSAEARTRVRTFAWLVRELPRYFRRGYGGAGIAPTPQRAAMGR
jgi:hypothetical protein